MKWSKRSVKNINTVSPILQLLAQKLISKTKYDIGVLNLGGKRTSKEQNAIFLDGKSKCDGYKILSYHQSGLAIDFVPYINGRYTWDNKEVFLDIAKKIFSIWEELEYSKFTNGKFLHWGGFWSSVDLDGNGLLEPSDKLGWDVAHYEIRDFKQIKGKYPFD